MYIVSTAQISLQQPLSDRWMQEPNKFEAQSYNRAADPDFKEWISPMSARRMSPIVRRAIATSVVALRDAGVENVDAIICGTGYGCVENTEKFLGAMIDQNEQFLQPTHFIQSTHNTVASQIALLVGCNGYNSTYVQHSLSFESALMDAFVQFELKNIETALVGGHDEMTDEYFKILSKIGTWKGDAFAGEGGVSMVLCARDNGRAMAKISAVDCCCKQSEVVERAQKMCQNVNLQALMLGRSGDPQNDIVYDSFVEKLGLVDLTAQFSYKNLCGEYPTASSFGVMAAIKILQAQKLDNILFFNHFNNEQFALILIEKC